MKITGILRTNGTTVLLLVNVPPQKNVHPVESWCLAFNFSTGLFFDAEIEPTMKSTKPAAKEDFADQIQQFIAERYPLGVVSIVTRIRPEAHSERIARYAFSRAATSDASSAAATRTAALPIEEVDKVPYLPPVYYYGKFRQGKIVAFMTLATGRVAILINIIGEGAVWFETLKHLEVDMTLLSLAKEEGLIVAFRSYKQYVNVLRVYDGKDITSLAIDVLEAADEEGEDEETPELPCEIVEPPAPVVPETPEVTSDF